MRIILPILCLALTACSGLSVRTDLAFGNREHVCAYGAPCRGPEAELAIGYDHAVSDTLTLRAELVHRSHLIANDRGEEFAVVSAVYRPWIAK